MVSVLLVKKVFDLIIKGGTVVDGTGNPWFKADIAVTKDKIVKIGDLSSDKADEIIDATGLIVSPGFIDMHSHSDISLLINPKAESKIMQGVTTEVIGNCGFSAAPLLDETIHLVKEEIETYYKNAELNLDWRSFDEYLKKLEEKGVAVNVASLVGQGTVRLAVMGIEDRSPSTSEMNKMKELVEEAMKSGAFGLSTGLIYPPGCYTKTDEIVELCKIVAKYGGIYASHIRGEGETLIEAVKEAIEIGEKANIPVEISHHKAGGRENWGKVKITLKMIEEARKHGIDVTCDVYPYIAASFGLSSMLPPWIHEGGTEKLLERLKDSKIRDRIKREMLEGLPGWYSPLRAAGWDKTIIAYCPKNKKFEGKSVLDISREEGLDPFDFVFNLLIEEEGAVSVVRFVLNENDVIEVISHPVSMIGSDGRALSPYGILGEGKPHPRSYGTFPRVIARYVRKKGVLSLEEAVRKMTSAAARKLGLWNRGIIRPNMYADLVIFDFNEIEDLATFENPHQFPKGIKYVIVNGKIVVKEGKHTGVLAGKVLRKNKQ